LYIWCGYSKMEYRHYVCLYIGINSFDNTILWAFLSSKLKWKLKHRKKWQRIKIKIMVNNKFNNCSIRSNIKANNTTTVTTQDWLTKSKFTVLCVGFQRV